MATNRKGETARKKSNDLDEYSKWLAVQNSEWSAPGTLEAALRKIEKEPSVWLNGAVDMMAFGAEAITTNPIELAARRCQASRALCEAARRDAVKLIGSPNRPGDSSDPIPRPYFDTPRQLGNADNSLETNLDAVSTEDFMVGTSGGHQKWFAVRAEVNSLIAWLRGYVPSRELELPVEAYMIEPMTKLEGAGYVPLTSALLWIMTDGDVTRRSLNDNNAWTAAANRLLPLLSTGEVEVVGRPATGGTSKTISGSVFAGIAIGFPLSDSIEMHVGDDPWIDPNVYVDEEYWRGGFNDQLFARKAAPATWTHLQVKKADILKFFASSSDPLDAPPLAKKRTATNFSGRGGITRAIQWAWTELFLNGLPEGMTSMERDDAIWEKIQSLKSRIVRPNSRTIQKALKQMKEGAG